MLSHFVFTASYHASDKKIRHVVLGDIQEGMFERMCFNDLSLTGSCKSSSLSSFQRDETWFVDLFYLALLFALHSKPSSLGHCTRQRETELNIFLRILSVFLKAQLFFCIKLRLFQCVIFYNRPRPVSDGSSY